MGREVVVTVKLRDAATAAAKKIKAAFQDLRMSLGADTDADDELRRVAKAADEATGAITANSKALASAAEIRRRFGLQSKRAERQVRRTTRALRASAAALAATGAAAVAAGRAMGRGLVLGVRKANVVLTGLTRGLVGVVRRLVSFRTLLIGLGTAAVIGGFAKVSATFEKSLSEIVGLVGVAEEQVDDWRKSILALAPAVGKGPGELAKAMFFVTSAGLRGAEALEVLEASAKAAAAGLGETEQVADAVTSAINAFGKENLSAEKAVGILVATVREGKAAADSIAGALGKVLPIAASVGVSFDQVGAAIAAMTRIGLDAEVATTALRAVLNGFLKVGPAAAEALEKVGLSAAGIRTQLREKGLLSVLFTLQKAIEGNEDALTDIIPNVRALTGVLSLVGENGEQVREIFEALAAETGQSLAQAFGVAQKTGAAAFARLAAAAERVSIKVGDFVNAVIRSGLGEFIESVLKVFGDELDRMTDSFGDSEGAAKQFSDTAIGVLKAVAFAAAAVVDGITLVQRGFLEAKIIGLQFMLFLDSLNDSTSVFGRLLELTNPALAAQGAALRAAKAAGADFRTQTEKQIQTLEKDRAGLRKTGTMLADLKRLLAEAAAQRANNANAAKAAAKADQAATGSKLALTQAQFAQIKSLERLNQLVIAGADRPLADPAAAAAAAEAAAAREATAALLEKVRALQNATIGQDELAKRIAALPTSFATAVLAIDDATQRLKELEVQEARSAERTKLLATSVSESLKTAADSARESFLEMTVAAGFDPLQAAVINFNATVEESTARAAQAAAQIWSNFLQESQFDAVASAKFVTDTIRNFASAVADFVGRVLDEAFAGQIRTIKDVAKIAQDVLKSLIKSIIQELVRLAVQAAVTKLVAGVAAEGAVFRGGFTPFQAGGVVTRPTLGLIGEAGQNEAVIPLPDGRNVPVKIQEEAGTRQAGQNVVVQVSAVDARSFQELMATPEGKESVRSAVAEATRFRPQFKKVLGGEG